MPRIRTIKPSFWTDEDLANISEPALILAVGLLNHADDEGFFKAHPGLIRAAVFPLREPSVNIQRMLTELSNIGYIRCFDGSDGKQYGQICSFLKHQRVSRPSPSEIKGLEKFSEDSVKTHGRKGKGKGREKEKERNLCTSDDVQGKRPQPDVLPDDEDEDPKNENAPGPDRVPVQAIVDMYHELLPELPTVQKITPARRGQIQQRWREDLKKPEHWRNFFTHVRESEFLMGKTPGKNGNPPFRADLEWLTKPGNFAKVAEGKYHRNIRAVR